MSIEIQTFKSVKNSICLMRAEDHEVGEGDQVYEVWLDEHTCLGLGDSEVEALQDAAQHTEDIARIIVDALKRIGGTANGANKQTR